MLTLIGVGHVFDIAARLKGEIAARAPEVVCLELDKERFQALIDRKAHPRERGGPVMYQMLSSFQQRIASQYGTEVGDEMLAAAEAARDLKAQIALIDINASQTFTEFWGGMSLKERVKLMVAAVVGMFAGKRGVEKEVERFEENPDDYMEAFSKEFPSAKRILIDKRDLAMADRLKELSGRFGKIVAVIGDGHVDGMSRHLAALKPEIIRLHQLRAPPDLQLRQDGSTYTFSFK